jgi:hypothetical protein
MRAFGTLVACDGVIQGACLRLFKDSRRSRTNEPVDDNRDRMMTRRRNGTSHRRDFAATQTAQNLKRIAITMQRQTSRNSVGFAGQTLVINASAAPGPIRCLAPE